MIVTWQHGSCLFLGISSLRLMPRLMTHRQFGQVLPPQPLPAVSDIADTAHWEPYGLLVTGPQWPFYRAAVLSHDANEEVYRRYPKPLIAQTTTFDCALPGIYEPWRAWLKAFLRVNPILWSARHRTFARRSTGSKSTGSRPEIMPSRGCEGGRDGWQARRRRRSRHGSFLPTKPVYEARTQAWGNGNLDRRATGLGCEY